MNFKKDNYRIIFVTGSSGNFLRRLIDYYFSNNQNIENLPLLETGEAVINSNFKNNTNPLSVVTLHDNSAVENDLTTIVISYTDDDIDLISRMFWFKRINESFAKTTYDTLKGPDWPEFQTYLVDPTQHGWVTNEIVSHNKNYRKEWIENNNPNQFDYEVEFKTIMGLNDKDLNREIAKIVGLPVKPEAQNYIDRYRKINYNLYLK